MPAIYRKTDKGRAEIETRAHRLAPRMRAALIVVDGHRQVSWAGIRLAVAGDLPTPGTIVECCIRPENVRLVWRERVAGRANLLHGRLRSEVKRGIDYLLRFHADGEAGEAGEISVSCPGHLHSLMKLRPDMEVWISLPPEQLHVLEPGES